VIFWNEPTKNPSKEHGCDEAPEHDDRGESSIHSPLIVLVCLLKR
jgi:hypothetical protein